MSQLFWMLLAVAPLLAAAITITPNGRTPPLQLATPEATESNYAKSRKLNFTNLSINERVRRLIPYMTFYYTNEATPQYTVPKNVEIQKASINAKDLRTFKYVVPSKGYYTPVPRYKDNRPQHYKISQKPLYLNPSGLEQDFRSGSTFGRTPYKHPIPWNKPELNLLNNGNKNNVQYYITDNESSQKYKLVPYDQTPPVKVTTENKLADPIPVPVISYPFKKTVTSPIYYSKKPEPIKPTTITESYFESSPKAELLDAPKIESGFIPMQPTDVASNDNYETNVKEVDIEVAKPTYNENVKIETPLYIKTDSIQLAQILKSLQSVKTIPQRITTENIDTSIKTLIEKVRPPVLSTPKPFFKANDESKVVVKEYPVNYQAPLSEDEVANEVPSQYLDDIESGPYTSQSFPLNEEQSEGGTPGRPGIDYPTYDSIPETSFGCKTQRYKGFFADPETRCQVWHYCDLNGGQASFLCPNGTVFSQAALTCDWWFNVRCASTAQLYVLNERLYKYILPHQPKFPEDFAGPLVDKYLTLKFKEMEEQFQKNKRKQQEPSTEQPQLLIQSPVPTGMDSSTIMAKDYSEMSDGLIAQLASERSLVKEEGIQIHHVGATGEIPAHYLISNH